MYYIIRTYGILGCYAKSLVRKAYDMTFHVPASPEIWFVRKSSLLAGDVFRKKSLLSGSRISSLAWIELGTHRKILENTSNVGCIVTCESLDRLVCICGENS